MVEEFRAIWSAGPGIDLLRGPAVPLRAYLESTLLTTFTGSIDDVYPGFDRAVLPNAPKSPVISEWDRWPSLNTRQQEPLFGSFTSHILRVDRIDRDVTAIVCGYDYAVAERAEGGRFVSLAQSAAKRGLPNPGVGVTLVKMKAPDAVQNPALPPQRGAYAAPSDDVFGGWQVTGFLNVFAVALPGFDHEWPTFDTDRTECVTSAPDDAARRTFLINGSHPRTDFPTAVADPGWPASGK